MCSISSSSRPEPLELIERELCELASHIHAATCRWLCLVAEFDDRRGWADWGCRSCAHWISWRCSIAPVAAREHVRVAHRVAELARVREAFACGRLSYSKVRAISRVDGIEHEEALVRMACCATAAQLERIVRAYRGVVGAERAAVAGPERWVHWHHDDDGALVLRARLPADEGAVVLAALDAAMERLEGVEHGASAEAGGDVPSPSEPGGSAESDQPDADLNRRAGPVVSVAADQPGGDPEPLSEPDVSAVAVAAEARPGVGDRRADGLLLMAENLLANATAVRGDDRHQVVIHVDAAALVAESGRAELDDGTPIAASTAHRLACDAALVPLLERDGRTLNIGRKTRAIPSALRRALSSRDRGCRFPGCAQRRRLHAHHIRHWARGGDTSLDNVVQLCPHHHRLLHEGGYTLERGSSGFRFRRPDGCTVAESPRPPLGRPAALRERQRSVAPQACIPDWAGERLDLDLATQAMLYWAPATEAVGI